MTIVKQKLKALAEAANAITTDVNITVAIGADPVEVKAIQDYLQVAMPKTILALLAEIDRLVRKNDNQAESIREYQDLTMGGDVSLGMLKADLRVTSGERDQLKAENEALRNDAERYRFVRNPIGTSSPLAIWNEGKMPLFSSMADAVVDEFMAKEASHG